MRCSGKALNTESPPDCYAVVSLHEARIAHTHIDPHSNHPRWGERFIVPVAHDVEMLTVTVKDKDVVGTKFRGKVWPSLAEERSLSPPRLRSLHASDAMFTVMHGRAWACRVAEDA